MKRCNVFFWCFVFVVILLSGCEANTENKTTLINEPTASEQQASVKSLPSAPVKAPPEFVGRQACVQCHQQQVDAWQGSHHDLAMQPATEETVLGDFANARFNYFGTESSFYKKDNQFYVKTDGPDGVLTEYPIAYTFGVEPLQQYLIKFPGGRMQALNVVWDTRGKEEGGQRWFHLYPDEHINHKDELHWTGINQNWNYMCADCHSTNLQKNYSSASKSYDTTWSEIDVSCESCHGPASLHVQWARSDDDAFDHKGFSIVFDEREELSWPIQAETGNAKRSHPKTTNEEIDTCAACHSRRSTAFPSAHPGDGYLNNFQPALLDDPLYHADGQVNEEVYVYGSFVQSKMYHAGVTCSDCHNPHSLQLKAEGNFVCAQCHSLSKYDNKDHHLHAQNSSGGQCITCHMPAKNFMVVDSRNDHSFRIPRPDLSVSLGTPNVCNQCHTDKEAQWAADKLREKHGEPDADHYAYAITAGRNGWPDAEQRLTQLIADDSQPEIVRATAVSLLPSYLSNNSAPVLQMVAQGSDPLMTLALARVADRLPPQYRPAFAVPLLYEPSRVTQGLAASSLTGTSVQQSLQQFPAKVHQRLDEAIKDYLLSANFNADRPEILTNLGSHYGQQGLSQWAEDYFRQAIELAPYYTPAYINLADMLRSQGNEQAAQNVLQQGLSQVREQSVVLHSLGLSLVRQQRIDEALGYLQQAAESQNATSRYIYVYGIALHSTGDSERALTVLANALTQFPSDYDIISGLVSINREVGREQQALDYEKLLHKGVE